MFVNGLGDRCYFNCEDIDSGVKIFEEYTSSRPPTAELYVVSLHYHTQIREVWTHYYIHVIFLVLVEEV